MRVVSFFAGIGGIDLGLERAGHECVGQVEIDTFCVKVLEKHWPNVWRHDDILTVKPEDIPEADLWTGGFPCQDISNAGKRAGIRGERSGLFFDFMRLVRAVRPRYLLLENVAALLYRGMGDLLGQLADSGYDAEWSCIRASSMGAPHRRERLFVVAYAERGVQPWSEPCLGASRRVGREFQPIPWDEPWPDALARVRGVGHGFPGCVDRTDGIRNAVVPQVAEYIGRLLKDAEVQP